MSKPTAPGWYWYKFGAKPWGIVHISQFDDGLYVELADEPIFMLSDTANGWLARITAWSVPIDPPK